MKNRIAVRNQYVSYLGSATLVIALCSAFLLAFAVLGGIFGLWSPQAGLLLVQAVMIPLAAIITVLSIVVLTYQIIAGHYKGIINACLAFVIGFSLLTFTFYPTFLPPLYPTINDITTNTTNPPKFELQGIYRPDANPLIYGGSKVASQQQIYYPDIATIRTRLPAQQAFSRALVIANNLGWNILSEDDFGLRFEAIDQTSIFGFVDDIVVIVTPTGTTSNVDIRSVSRAGINDGGKNAKRVRQFISAYNAANFEQAYSYVP